MNQINPSKVSQTPALDRRLQRSPDLVDAIFAYILEQHPQLSRQMEALKRTERSVRELYTGQRGLYVRAPGPSPEEEAEHERLAARVMAYPSGTSIRQIARETGLSRRTVQALRQTPAQSVA